MESKEIKQPPPAEEPHKIQDYVLWINPKIWMKFYNSLKTSDKIFGFGFTIIVALIIIFLYSRTEIKTTDAKFILILLLIIIFGIAFISIIITKGKNNKD